MLTIGFARRFATYKRATLLLRDRARLARLVNDPERPVMFLFAGKAHPADEPGKQVLREIRQLMTTPQFMGRIIFLEDYDLQLARGSSRASMSGSTIRSRRSRRAAPPGSRPPSTAA